MPISDDAIRKYQRSYVRCRSDETTADAFYRLKEVDGYAWWYILVEFPNGSFGAVQAGELWTQFEQAADRAAFLRRRLGDLGLPGVRVAEKGSMGTAQAEALVPLVPPMVLVVVDRGQFVGILSRFDRGGGFVDIDYRQLEEAIGVREEAAAEIDWSATAGAATSTGEWIASLEETAAEPEAMAADEAAPSGIAAPPPPPPAPMASPPAPAPAQPAPAAAREAAKQEAQDFNVLIVDGASNRRLPAAQPLVANRPEPYYVRVFIGPWEQEQEKTRQDAFAAEAELRQQVFKEGEARLLCVLTTSTAWLEGDQSVVIRELVVPESGRSNTIQVRLSAPEAGRHFVDVDLYFHNHLMHSKTLSFYAVRAAGEAAAGKTETKVTFVRERAFAPKDLDDKTIRLTLRYAPPTPERGPSFTILTPGQTAGTKPFYSTDVMPEHLGKFAASARRWLAEIAATNQSGGAGTWNNFARHLTQLAKIGRDFYHAAFPEKSKQALAALHDPQRDTVIQIAPIASNASIPWNVIYDRPLEQPKYVCNQFMQHGLHDCPYGEDVVCPTGFWGYRHMIEQIPCWSDDPLLQPLTGEHGQAPQLQRFVRNRPGELVYCLNAYPFGQVIQDHRNYMQRLAGRKGLSLKQGQSVDDVRQQFKQGDIHVVHFFVHGGEEDGRHVLILRDNDPLEPGRVANWGARLWDEAPLVVLSGCGTGSYTPEDFSSLIVALLRSGVAGVIGTEVTIYTNAALAYANEFFDYLLHGSAAGYAMRDITRRLMAQYNPYGLVYTLFAVSGIRLKHPLLAA